MEPKHRANFANRRFGRNFGRNEKVGREKSGTGAAIVGNCGSESGAALVGTCEDMCPRAEQVLRIRERLLHKLEMGQNTGGPIKEFSRPAAGQKPPSPQEVRSPGALLHTTTHLLTVTLNCKQEPLHVIYDFIFDRLRAVRQDLVLQDLEDLTTLLILTRCVRFHLVFSLLLSPHPIARFDPHINFSHLLDCLKHCIKLHHKLGLKDEEREELSAVYLLLNLGRPEAINWAIKQGRSLKQLPLVKSSLAITRAYQEANYVRFFRLVRDLPPVLLLSVQRAVASMALLAVKIMNTGYSSANCRFPLSKLQELLLLENVNTAEELVRSQGLRIEAGAVRFKKEEFRGGGQPANSYFDLISSKIEMSRISDLIMDDGKNGLEE
jgi:SAC3 domain-containing protein 1